MAEQNPAIPAQSAANPGSSPQVPPSSAAPQTPTNNGGQGGAPEEKVTISLKEFRDLQRDHARVLSFDKRRGFNASRNNPAPQPGNGASGGQDDPEIVEQLRVTQERADAAERRAMQSEVRDGVRTILGKPEYANLPSSTKELILKNPSMLSEADSVEEALLDIEDFVREQAAAVVTPNSQPNSGQGGSSQANPPGHEAPPVVSAGAPAPVNAENLEDVSNLRGPARSQAILRNSIKKARGVK